MEGIGLEKLFNTVDVIEDGIDDGLHLGGQVFVQWRGREIADFAIGEFAEDCDLTPQTSMPWMSCSKMVTSVAVALFYERALLNFDTPVGSIIPEFASHGKENITIKHLLTHTCGFRVLKGVRWEDMSWDESIAAICSMPIEKDWQPGKRAGYHVGTSFFILGEVLRRLDGRPVEEIVRQEIFKPLGMENCYMAIPLDLYTDEDLEIARFYTTNTGEPRPQRDTYLTAKNRCKPGASCRGPIAELAKMMTMLANGGMGENGRFLQQETVDYILRPARTGLLDETFGKRIDWALGFMLDSKQYQKDYPYSFGYGASGSTFGHNGNQSTAAYVDPENELVICWAFNGMPGEEKHQERLLAMNNAIYKDLGLLR